MNRLVILLICMVGLALFVGTAAADVGEIDDFEDGDMDEWRDRVGASGSIDQFATTTNRSWSGSRSLELKWGSDSVGKHIASSPGDGLQTYPSPEDSFEFFIYSESREFGEFRVHMFDEESKALMYARVDFAADDSGGDKVGLVATNASGTGFGTFGVSADIKEDTWVRGNVSYNGTHYHFRLTNATQGDLLGEVSMQYDFDESGSLGENVSLAVMPDGPIGTDDRFGGQLYANFDFYNISDGISVESLRVDIKDRFERNETSDYSVIATYDNGDTEDVTLESMDQSNATDILTVDGSGTATAKDNAGWVRVNATYEGVSGQRTIVVYNDELQDYQFVDDMVTPALLITNWGWVTLMAIAGVSGAVLTATRDQRMAILTFTALVLVAWLFGMQELETVIVAIASAGALVSRGD